MKRTEDKIKIFLEAIPWLKDFKGKTFVLKYGGELLLDEKNIQNIADDIDLLCTLGIRPVIVHGGGPQLDSELKKQGIEFERKNGLRVTSKEILSSAQRVFPEISRQIRKKTHEHNVNTKLISRDYVRVKRVPGLGYVGKVTSINPLFSKMAVDCLVPIMPLMGWDEEGNLCNINADDMAVSVAETLKAEKLIIHTSVDGVLDEEGRRITHLDLKVAEKMIAEGHIKGGMIPKVIHALESEKVDKIHIINGQIPHALLYEVFTSEGIGTEIVR